MSLILHRFMQYFHLNFVICGISMWIITFSKILLGKKSMWHRPRTRSLSDIKVLLSINKKENSHCSKTVSLYEFKIDREFSNFFFVIISMKWTKSERNHEATEYRYININEVTTRPFWKDLTSTRYNSNISRHDFFYFAYNNQNTQCYMKFVSHEPMT